MAVAKMRFNEHDWKHRESCFNKGMECQYSFSKSPKQKFDIVFGDDTEEQHGMLCTVKEKILKREFSQLNPNENYLYMNTHNPAVATLLGFNNNITSGNRDASYYITMYSTNKIKRRNVFYFEKSVML